MPDSDEMNVSENEPEPVLSSVNAVELPALNPPQTKTPISFNQQVNNFQQIPPSAWDGLTPEQRMELTRSILTQMDAMDKRHYDFAMTHVQTEAKRGTVATVCGAVIAVLGFSASAYLSLHGQTIVALSITMPLATILAIVVGNRFVTRS